MEPPKIEIQAHFVVTSRDTALWDPGFHEFDMEGDGHVTSPIDQVFSISGNGSVDYTMVGPNPWPPGPMTGKLNYSGTIGNSTWGGLGLNSIGGPIVMEIFGFSAETLEIMEKLPEEYLRKEAVFILWLKGVLDAFWDPSPFNVTDGTFTVNFIQIADEGKFFEIDVNGTVTAFPMEEPEPVPELSFLSVLAAAALVAFKLRRT